MRLNEKNLIIAGLAYAGSVFHIARIYPVQVYSQNSADSFFPR